MSSEMRECPFCGNDAWVVRVPDTRRFRPQCKKCGADLGEFDREADAVAAWNRRALLARTEAGADGAAMLVRDVCEMPPADPDAPDAVCIRVTDLTRIAEQYTRPQDASGDAEDAKRMDWLVANVTETLTVKSIRGEFPYPEHKTQYVLPRLTAWADFHGQVGFREAIDIAMQAKEAK